MVVKMSYLEKIDRYLDSLKVGKSALVDSWFMMSSPVGIVGVVVLYLLLVKLGPRFMKNREPMRITKLMGYYNAAQVFLSLLICVKTVKLPHLMRDGIIYIGCRYPSHTQNYQLLDLGWWYFFAKFTELLDTLFFILRKKEKQISFLHVYHHALMAIYSWSYLKFAAGGEGAILGFLNSAVHVVMYMYYLLSGLGPRFQKYLWWKKYVTTMQMVQFIIMLAYCFWTHISPRCQYAPGFTYFISGNVVIFLLLFLNFYSKSYKKSKMRSKSEIKEDVKKTQNGIQKNGLINRSFVSNGTKNGLCCNDFRSSFNVEDHIAYKPDEKSCRGFAENGDMFLSRRTSKETFNSKLDFDRMVKK